MKNKLLKKLNLIVAAVVLIVLTACSTIDIIHEPVGCLGYPDTAAFTEEDLKDLSDEAYEKIFNTMLVYKLRLKSQCQINEAHDEIHN